jgi:hypothetical protein
MGARGPVGKRSDQRLGHRAKAEMDEVDKIPATPVRPTSPEPEEKWHPLAKRWYESLAASGQSVFYEPSDWATAVLIAESISRDLKPQFVGLNEESGEPIFESIPMKGASLAGYLKAMTALVVTEGDRRRAGIELQRGTGTDEDEEAADATVIDAHARFTG